jgi:spore germination protein YaaH
MSQMSKITSPILLDSTGKDINETLQGIQYALKCGNTIIDDRNTSDTTTWSSKKIAEVLTVTAVQSGSTVTISPIAATPIIVSGYVEAGNLTLTQSNDKHSITRTVYIPVAGHFTWTTGELIVAENGEVARLAANAIKAFPGTNTLTISAGTMDVKYRTIGTGSGSDDPCDCSWDIISGGSAAEEV